MTREDTVQAAEANRLYWNHSASVGDIANKLGISRRALYEVIEPQPADVTCPNCGTQTVFVNRSAQASGLARCPSCQTETQTTPAAPHEEEVAGPAPRRADPKTNGSAGARLKVGIGSAALVGVVVGAIATLLVTQRD